MAYSYAAAFDFSSVYNMDFFRTNNCTEYIFRENREPSLTQPVVGSVKSCSIPFALKGWQFFCSILRS